MNYPHFKKCKKHYSPTECGECKKEFKQTILACLPIAYEITKSLNGGSTFHMTELVSRAICLATLTEAKLNEPEK